MKIAKALPFTFVFLAGCASHDLAKTATPDGRACAKNFTYDRGLLTETVYRTHEVLGGIEKDEALKNTTNYIMLEGWKITNSDQELGILSAAQNVSFSDRKTAPLNISFTPNEEGLNVSVSFAISAGIHSPADEVRKTFCEMIASARLLSG